MREGILLAGLFRLRMTSRGLSVVSDASLLSAKRSARVHEGKLGDHGLSYIKRELECRYTLMRKDFLRVDHQKNE